MKARIINNSEFGGIFTDEFIQENWEVTDVLPDDNLINKKWNGLQWIEGLSLSQINDLNIQKAIEIDLYYTKKISELLVKPIEKLNCDGIPIPQSKLDERDALRVECNAKIAELGITDYAYRQSVPKLAKF